MKEKLIETLPNDVEDLVTMLEQGSQRLLKAAKRKAEQQAAAEAGVSFKLNQKMNSNQHQEYDQKNPRRPKSWELVKQVMPIVVSQIMFYYDSVCYNAHGTILVVLAY